MRPTDAAVPRRMGQQRRAATTNQITAVLPQGAPASSAAKLREHFRTNRGLQTSGPAAAPDKSGPCGSVGHVFRAVGVLDSLPLLLRRVTRPLLLESLLLAPFREQSGLLALFSVHPTPHFDRDASTLRRDATHCEPSRRSLHRQRARAADRP